MKYIFLDSPGFGQFTVPSDWANIDNWIGCVGAGAGSGLPSLQNYLHTNGGGGGGAFSKKNNVSLTIGAAIPYNVGLGGLGATDGGPSVFGGTTLTSCICGAEGGLCPRENTVLPFYTIYGNKGIGGRASVGTGDIKFSGGDGGRGWWGEMDGIGGAGGGGAAGPNGNGAHGGNSGSIFELDSSGGAGGGGANGGYPPPDFFPFQLGDPYAPEWFGRRGGNGYLNTGGGSPNSGSGSVGGGGGGADFSMSGLPGGNGGSDLIFDATHGCGGGGGGGGGWGTLLTPSLAGQGGNGGKYGGGGGAVGGGYWVTNAFPPGAHPVLTSGYGADGLIVIAYQPNLATAWTCGATATIYPDNIVENVLTTHWTAGSDSTSAFVQIIGALHSTWTGSISSTGDVSIIFHAGSVFVEIY